MAGTVSPGLVDQHDIDFSQGTTHAALPWSTLTGLHFRSPTTMTAPEQVPRQHCRDTEQPDLNATVPLSQRAFIGQAPLDGFKQGCNFERLSQKALGADRARFLEQSRGGQRRDQDYGYFLTLFAELSDEVESAHSGQCNVGDDAIERGRVARRKIRLRRSKRLSAMTNGTHQIHQGVAKLVIIVDDRNESVTHQMQPGDVRRMA
jgi:hypothetical protein